MDFKKLPDDIAEQVINCIPVMHEAGYVLLQDALSEKELSVEIAGNIIVMIDNALILLKQHIGDGLDDCSLTKILKSIQVTVRRLISRAQDMPYRRMKLQYELIPLLEEAYQHAYYWLWASKSKERMEQYKRDIPALCANHYIDAAEESGEYKYDVSFVITGYNKLEYTRMCVESLLRNIPQGLNYELILVNHGSGDGTMEYFESIRPTKQLDIAINGGGSRAVARIVESRYTIGISNDVLVTPNAIQNMLSCLESDPNVAWVVPTTPNIANLQSIHAKYNSMDELEQFARQNNIADPYRWEERTRLHNPIAASRNAVFYGSNGILYTGHAMQFFLAFPDDMIAYLLRRRGYKMMLAKDAYCHHFGSVTIKGEIADKKDSEYYNKGRRAFYDAFGIDPWGTGFCFDPVFLDRVVGEHTSHVDVLGLNCGMGSNSLKIKEQIKEYCHNTDIMLVNLTDNSKFILDLKGISDHAGIISGTLEFKKAVSGQNFHYVVWDDPFIWRENMASVAKVISDHLTPDGKLVVKLNERNRRAIAAEFPNVKELGNSWAIAAK